MEEADFFSDDDLDLIPDNTLLELEQNAISSTQKPQHVTARPTLQPLRPKQAHNASSLNRSRGVNNNVPWRPPQRLTQVAKVSQNVPEPPSQQELYEDENVINLADDAPIANWSQSQRVAERQTSVPLLYKSKPALDSDTAAAFAAADAELSKQQVVARPRGLASRNDENALKARIAALEAEATEARQAELEARRALEAKAGEITIVRANADKERKEHDRRVLALQKGYAEEAVKHKRDLEAGRKEREKMQTDNRFLQHDLAQEAERVKRLNGPGKARTVLTEHDTPKKARRAGLGDGFNDEEVLGFSPSRSKDRQGLTPRAGAKRKRSAQDSPIASLSFAKPPLVPREDSRDIAQPLPTSTAVLLVADEGEGIRYMQRLLEYRPLGGTSRALEVLSLHHIPSLEERSLSSILMEALSISRHAGAHDTLPLQTMRVMARLWKACLDEQHAPCVSLLVDLILFAMRHEVPSRYNCLAEEVVPLCLRSLEIVTLPVVRAHLKGPLASTDASQQHPLEQIDATQVTALLNDMCQACALAGERIETFWRMIDFTSSMLLLHKALPMDRVITGLRILYTSALRDSFGAINSKIAEQEQQERDTVFRLTFAFFDIPAVPLDEPAYDEEEIADFRIIVLEVLTRLCESDHGSLLLATHTHFLGRLVRFIDEQIRKLYSLAPSQQQFADPSTSDRQANGHDLVVRTVNMSMRILHCQLTTHGDIIDLSEKFSVVVGGYHKFLIGMTRLAFIEQPTVFEYGIDEEVIDTAHSILDAFLTPEDGEAVAQALETPQASKGTAAQEQQSHSIDEDAMDTDELTLAPD